MGKGNRIARVTGGKEETQSGGKKSAVQCDETRPSQRRTARRRRIVGQTATRSLICGKGRKSRRGCGRWRSLRIRIRPSGKVRRKKWQQELPPIGQRRNDLLPQHQKIQKMSQMLKSFQDKMLQRKKKASKWAKTCEQMRVDIKKQQDDPEDVAKNIEAAAHQEARLEEDIEKCKQEKADVLVMHLRAVGAAWIQRS